MERRFTAKTVANIFVKEVVHLYGIPSFIVSDHDPLFLRLFWTQFFRLLGTKLKMSITYHLEMDGQSEVLGRLEMHLHCFAFEQPWK